MPMPDKADLWTLSGRGDNQEVELVPEAKTAIHLSIPFKSCQSQAITLSDFDGQSQAENFVVESVARRFIATYGNYLRGMQMEEPALRRLVGP